MEFPKPNNGSTLRRTPLYRKSTEMENDAYRKFFSSLSAEELQKIFTIQRKSIIDYVHQMFKQAPYYSYFFYTTVDFVYETPMTKSIGHFAIKPLESISGPLHVETLMYWDRFLIDRLLFFSTEMSNEVKIANIIDDISKQSSKRGKGGKKKKGELLQQQQQQSSNHHSSLRLMDADIFSSNYKCEPDTMTLMPQLFSNPQALLRLMIKVSRGNFLSSLRQVTQNEKKDHVCALGWFGDIGYCSLATYVANLFEESFWIYFHRKRAGHFQLDSVQRMNQINMISQLWKNVPPADRKKYLPPIGLLVKNIFTHKPFVISLHGPFVKKFGIPIVHPTNKKEPNHANVARLTQLTGNLSTVWFSEPYQSLLDLAEFRQHDMVYLGKYENLYGTLPKDGNALIDMALSRLFYFPISFLGSKRLQFYSCLGALLRQNIILQQGKDLVKQELNEAALKAEAVLLAQQRRELERIEKEKKRRKDLLEQRKMKQEAEQKAKLERRRMMEQNLAMKRQRSIKKGVESILLELLAKVDYEIAKKRREKQQAADLIAEQQKQQLFAEQLSENTSSAPISTTMLALPLITINSSPIIVPPPASLSPPLPSLPPPTNLMMTTTTNMTNTTVITLRRKKKKEREERIAACNSSFFTKTTTTTVHEKSIRISPTPASIITDPPKATNGQGNVPSIPQYHQCADLCNEHFFSKMNHITTCKQLTDNIYYFMNQLTEYMCYYINPIRESIINVFIADIKSILPHSIVEPYGSTVYGICDWGSDIDLVIMNVPEKMDGQETFDLLFNILSKKKWVRKCKPIKTAKIPIIKLEHAVSGIELDITLQYSSQAIQTHKGIQTAHIIQRYITEYPELVPLGIILKQFMRQNRLHLPFYGGINSYGLLLMIVVYLQLYSHYADNLGQLLLGFFKLYGFHFPFEYMGIDAKTRKFFIIEAEERTRNLTPAHSSPPATVILDPCDPTFYNVAYSAFNIHDIRKAFREAFRSMTQNDISNQSGNLLSYVTSEVI